MSKLRKADLAASIIRAIDANPVPPLFANNEQGLWYALNDPNEVAPRRNMLTYSEDLTNGAWVKLRSVITANATVAPDGTMTADKLVQNTSESANHMVYRNVLAICPRERVAYSYYAKLGDIEVPKVRIYVYWWNSTYTIEAGCGGLVDLRDNTVSTYGYSLGGDGIYDMNDGTNINCTSTPVGNGWYRIVLETNIPNVPLTRLEIQISTESMDWDDSPEEQRYRGVPGKGPYIWGAQLEPINITDYQRVTTDWATELPKVVSTKLGNAALQDATGTTAVTAVEQPVGLMLDKRLGLVRGPELVSNGGFADATGWTLGAGWTIGAGVAASTGSGILSFNTGMVAGKWYEITFEVTAYTSGGVQVRAGGANGGYPTPTVGLRRLVVLSGGGLLEFVSTTLVASIDNVSVRELPGNHATQATTAAKPILSARKNLLTKTETLTDAVWAKTFVTVAGDLVKEDATSNFHYLNFPSATFAIGDKVMVDLEVKAAGVNTISLEHTFGGGRYLVVDLTTGAATPTAIELPYSVTDAGDGWWRITCGFIVGIAGARNARLFLRQASASGAYVGDGVSGVRVRRPQTYLSDVATATTYQRVTTATDYDTAGFLHYEKFDGTDDGVQASTTFASSMDVFLLMRRNNTANFMLAFGGVADQASKYIGCGQSANASLPHGGVGTPPFNYYVNGVLVGAGGAATTRGDLHAAIPVGSWCVVEIRGPNLESWTAFAMGNYTNYALNAGVAEVVVLPAQTDANRTKIRKYLANKAGITLP